MLLIHLLLIANIVFPPFERLLRWIIYKYMYLFCVNINKTVFVKLPEIMFSPDLKTSKIVSANDSH